MSLIHQVEVATRELVEDELPRLQDIPRIVAGIAKVVETGGTTALEQRAAKLVEQGVVDAEEFARHFVKTQVEVHAGVEPTNETAQTAETQADEAPVAEPTGW